MLGYLLAPCISLYLYYRVFTGKEDKNRLKERKGISALKRPSGDVVWVHAASVGEALTALSVVEFLCKDQDDLSIIFTTGTVSSASLIEKRLPLNVIHQYFPLDLKPWVERFLDNWHPQLVLWFESELWPSHLDALKQRKIPAILLNGRISDKSFKRWSRFSGAFKRIMQTFELIYTASVRDQNYFHKLGIDRAVFKGNLKLTVSAAKIDEAYLERLQLSCNNRRVWLASSTHAGEEEMIASVQVFLQSFVPLALCVLVPRHPGRAQQLKLMLCARGLRVCLRSEQEVPSHDCDVFLADTFGELDLFYQLSPIAFVGGSLVPIGGHNMLEAIRQNSVVVTGPYVSNFHDLVNELLQNRACIQVQDEAELTCVMQKYFLCPHEFAFIAENARKIFDMQHNMMSDLCYTVEKYLHKNNGKE